MKRYAQVPMLVLAMIFGLAATGAQAGSIAPQDKPVAPRGTAKYEAWLTKEVRHHLLMLPYYSVFDNLEYSVKGSTVTLYGQVARASLKDDAEHAVRDIEGVEKVENKIEILPVSINDDRIRREVYRAVYSFPQLQKYSLGVVQPIHIIVKNGNVALEGVVANEGDKNVAYLQANGVPGVFSVTNHLQVEK